MYAIYLLIHPLFSNIYMKNYHICIIAFYLYLEIEEIGGIHLHLQYTVQLHYILYHYIIIY